MAVYVVTGKLGGGKTLISVKRIRDKLQAGRIIATNLDLNLQHLISPFNKTARVIRIPDKPSIDDLKAIGKGTESYEEEDNGLLVLDECGTWFNSRNWNDKSRKSVNDWFLHARKLGWDVILIIQDVSQLDSQARMAIAEHTVFCRRTDRLTVPFLGTAIKALTGYRITLPKAHLGRVVYGISEADLLVDRWAARGLDLYAAYDTKQAFLDDYPHGAHSLLPPWHTHGRYMAPRNWKFVMRLTRIYWKRFRAPLALGVGCLLGTSVALAALVAANYDPRPEPVEIAENASQAATALETLIEAPEDDPVLSKLANVRIVGYMTVDGQITYHLERPGTEEEMPAELTSVDLEGMGYEVQPVNRCSLVVGRGPVTVPIYCF